MGERVSPNAGHRSLGGVKKASTQWNDSGSSPAWEVDAQVRRGRHLCSGQRTSNGGKGMPQPGQVRRVPRRNQG